MICDSGLLFWATLYTTKLLHYFCEALQLIVDRNVLFDELLLVQSITHHLSYEMSVEERWIKVFHSTDKSKLKTHKHFPHRLVCSQHSSNPVVERVISVP